jgi:hypothetical protein
MAKTFQKLTRLSIRGLRAGGEISEHGLRSSACPTEMGYLPLT